MFLDSLDIANRALDHCGQEPILSVTEDSKKNQLCARVYDKVRRAELRRNYWRFSIKKCVLRAVDTTTLKLNPLLYSSATTYFPGSIVKDSNGALWVSITEENINNTPGANNENWEAYFGPMTVDLWASTNSYWTGELVYMITGAATYQLFMSLQNSNTDTPNVATAYSATTTYTIDQTVTSGGSQWRSLLELNLNNTPTDYSALTLFDIGATYAINQQVIGSDHYVYTSKANGNIGNDPTTSTGVTHWTVTGLAAAWALSPALVVSSIKWLPVQCQLSNFQMLYPVGAGPSSQTSTMNIFHLPGNFLKIAPQGPKAGANPYLGAPTGLAYTDWNLEGNLMVSQEIQPIIFRFVADVTKVRNMDDMFCEGLACRIAAEVCEPLTQSSAKLTTIAGVYAKFMGDARTTNAIEIGSEEPPEDDLITCRA